MEVFQASTDWLLQEAVMRMGEPVQSSVVKTEVAIGSRSKSKLILGGLGLLTAAAGYLTLFVIG